MVLTLYLFGIEVFTISVSTEDHFIENEQVTRSIGFAAAELAEPPFDQMPEERVRRQP